MEWTAPRQPPTSAQPVNPSGVEMSEHHQARCRDGPLGAAWYRESDDCVREMQRKKNKMLHPGEEGRRRGGTRASRTTVTGPWDAPSSKIGAQKASRQDDRADSQTSGHDRCWRGNQTPWAREFMRRWEKGSFATRHSVSDTHGEDRRKSIARFAVRGDPGMSRQCVCG